MSSNYHASILLLAVFMLTGCINPTISDNPALSDNPSPLETDAHTEQPPQKLMQQVSESSKKIALLDTVLACMEKTDSLDASELAKEIKRMQIRSTVAQSLETNVYTDYLIERFSLACLLGRDSGTVQEWDSAQAILTELTSQFEHEDEQQLVRYVARSLELQRKLRQHQSQLNRLRQQNTELQNKIEQLKGLERDLDVNNPYSVENGL